MRAHYINFCFIHVFLAVICVVVCLPDIFLFISSNVMFLALEILALEISFPRTDGLCLLFSSLCFYSDVQTTNPKPTKKQNLATCFEIGAIVEFEMIPPWALQVEAQGFKQLQA